MAAVWLKRIESILRNATFSGFAIGAGALALASCSTLSTADLESRRIRASVTRTPDRDHLQSKRDWTERELEILEDNLYSADYRTRLRTCAILRNNSEGTKPLQRWTRDMAAILKDLERTRKSDQPASPLVFYILQLSAQPRVPGGHGVCDLYSLEEETRRVILAAPIDTETLSSELRVSDPVYRVALLKVIQELSLKHRIQLIIEAIVNHPALCEGDEEFEPEGSFHLTRAVAEALCGTPSEQNRILLSDTRPATAEQAQFESLSLEGALSKLVQSTRMKIVAGSVVADTPTLVSSIEKRDMTIGEIVFLYLNGTYYYGFVGNTLYVGDYWTTPYVVGLGNVVAAQEDICTNWGEEGWQCCLRFFADDMLVKRLVQATPEEGGPTGILISTLRKLTIDPKNEKLSLGKPSE